MNQYYLFLNNEKYLQISMNLEYLGWNQNWETGTEINFIGMISQKKFNLKHVYSYYKGNRRFNEYFSPKTEEVQYKQQIISSFG